MPLLAAGITANQMVLQSTKRVILLQANCTLRFLKQASGRIGDAMGSKHVRSFTCLASARNFATHTPKHTLTKRIASCEAWDMEITLSHQVKNALMCLSDMEDLCSLCNIMFHGTGD